jgi:predicted transcriptional regulator
MTKDMGLTTLTQLSAILGVSIATVVRYRNGEVKPPRSVRMHLEALKHLPGWRRIYLMRMGRKIAVQAKRARDRAEAEKGRSGNAV